MEWLQKVVTSAPVRAQRASKHTGHRARTASEFSAGNISKFGNKGSSGSADAMLENLMEFTLRMAQVSCVRPRR